jgi:hypothetical protein
VKDLLEGLYHLFSFLFSLLLFLFIMVATIAFALALAEIVAFLLGMKNLV